MGDAQVMFAGGSEATIVPIGIGGFCAMKAMSTRNHEPAKSSRPFDVERDGFVMGEGAGVLVLEELDHARARGAAHPAEHRPGRLARQRRRDRQRRDRPAIAFPARDRGLNRAWPPTFFAGFRSSC